MIPGIPSKKYIGITKIFKTMFTRDLQDLVAKEVFTSIGAGRIVRYELGIGSLILLNFH